MSQTDFDMGPLTWVKAEIDASLARATESLNEALTHPNQHEPVRFAQTHIHQASGALSIVGLNGVTQFAEAIDKLLSALAGAEEAPAPESLDLARRALAALANYLNELLAGAAHKPLRLFPMYAELVAARGDEPPVASELFFPDLSVRPQLSGISPIEPDAAAHELRLLRGRFEKGLLMWLRQPQSNHGAEEMLRAVQRIEQIQSQPVTRAFWWAAIAFFEGLAQGIIPVERATQRLCRRIDMQMRRLLEGSQVVAERLVRDVLYFVATANITTPHAKAVRNVYKLEAALPRADQALSDTLRQPLAARVHETLEHTKDAWNRFAAGAAAALPQFQDHLAELTQRVAAMQLPALDELLVAVKKVGDYLRADPVRLTEALSMELATGLLVVEQAAESPAYDPALLRKQVDLLTTIYEVRSKGGRPPMMDDALFGQAAQRAQEKLFFNQLAREILTNLGQIEQTLDSFFRNAAQREPLEGLAGPLKQIEGAFAMLGENDAVTLIRDSAAQINAFAQGSDAPSQETCDAVAHKLSALGFYVEALKNGPAKLQHFLDPSSAIAAEEDKAAASSTVEAKLVRESREASHLAEALKETPQDDALRGQLMHSLEAMREDAQLVADASLEQQTKEVIASLKSGADVSADKIKEVLSSVTAPAVVQPSEEAARLMQVSTEELDAELLAIFLEEANEVIATQREHRDIAARENSHDALVTVRRGFHTLKGSSRMVGLEAFSDAAKHVEMTMNRWLQLERGADPEILSLIDSGTATFSEWVKQLEAGGNAWRDATALETQAQDLLATLDPGDSILPRRAVAEGPATALPGTSEIMVGAETSVVVPPALSALDLDISDEESTAEPMAEASFELSASPAIPVHETSLEETVIEMPSLDSLGSDLPLDLPIEEESPTGTLEPDSDTDDFDARDIAEIDLASTLMEGDLERLSSGEAEIGEMDLTATLIDGLMPEEQALLSSRNMTDLTTTDLDLHLGEEEPIEVELTHTSLNPRIASLLDGEEPPAEGGFAETNLEAMELSEPPLEIQLATPISMPAPDEALPEFGFTTEEPAEFTLASPTDAIHLPPSPDEVAPMLDDAIDMAEVGAEIELPPELEPHSEAELELTSESAEIPSNVAPIVEMTNRASDLEEVSIEEEDGNEVELPVINFAALNPASLSPDSVAPRVAELVQEAPVADPDITVGDNTLSRGLYDMYLAESVQHLASLRELQQQLDSNPLHVPEMPAVRAAHTLAGISGTARFDSVYVLAKALEHALARLHEVNLPPDAAQITLLGNTLQQLESMFAQIREMAMPLPVPELVSQLDNLVPMPPVTPAEAVAEPEPIAVAVVAEDEDSPIIKVQDELDEQLLPIFLEEADELSSEIGSSLREMRQDPSAADPRNALARLLHTVKGSARMAGAMRLGEFVHGLESRLDALNGPALVDEMEAGFDHIGLMLEALRNPDAHKAAASAPPASMPESAEHADETGETPEIAPASGRAREQEAVIPAVLMPQVAAPEEEAAQTTRATVRVRADMVDRFVNEAGEISIARTRVEGEMRTLRRSLLDLTENVIRLRNQLREVEIQAESQMQSRIAATGEHANFDPLEFDRFTRLQEVTRMMAESVGDVATVQQNLLRNLDAADSALHAQGRLSRDLQQALMSVRMVPFNEIADRLHRVVRQTARELGKRTNLDIVGGGIEIDRGVLDKMVAPIEHLLRNSIAHGIEDGEVRAALGKAPIGQITLTLTQRSNEITLELRDDGQGLNFERIAARGRKVGLIGEHEEVGENRLTQLIFEPGFSTAETVSGIAGRGVGMDVVKNETLSVGGRIDIATIRGEGTSFLVHLPLTLAVTQALLVRAAGRTYAIPSNMVEQAVEVKEDALAKIRANGYAEWKERKYPLRYLPRLLGDRETQPPVARYHWILMLHAGNETLGLYIDELVGNQEIVVKNAGPQFVRLQGYTGATVLPDGEVSLILNPVVLASRQAAPAGDDTAAVIAPVQQETEYVPTIMVVDDSLTVRKITSRLLERAGYRVVTAKDGVDALEQLTEILPDVMLSDIEMPRMDGFDLARNVRGDERLQTIPIIMITSRMAEKHRNYAMEIGVNHYLGKPYQEEELLELIAAFIYAKKRGS